MTNPLTPLRWLQWSTIDLENGLGGVEVHARVLARELKALGIEVGFSRDPSVWANGTEEWDVIHTHGSAIPFFSSRSPRGPTRVHTLHGTTLGRMASCGEWTWPGGYAAEAREIRGVFEADVVLSVHPELSLLKLARKIGRATAVCLNGWDAGTEIEKPPDPLEKLLGDIQSSWLFVGRGGDWVKGVDRLETVLGLMPDLSLIAVPGEGFEKLPGVRKTGRLAPGQIRTLLDHSAGLVLCSRYEGNSLALLEALAQGVPVVSTPVGAAPLLSGRVEGLVVTDSHDPRAIADALRGARRFPIDQDSREKRAIQNRLQLPTWKQVAQTSLSAVESYLQRPSAKRKS